MEIKINLENGAPANTAQIIVTETVETGVFTGSLLELQAQLKQCDAEIALIETRKADIQALIDDVTVKFAEQGVADVNAVVE